MKAQVVPAEDWHVSFIAACVRQADADEMYAIGCYTPEAALRISLRVSDMAWTGLIGSKPVCMFGVAGASLLTNTGRPWLIGTDLLDTHYVIFLRRCRRMVVKMLDRFPSLENYVDVRNTRAITWLRWLGFSFNEPEPYGVLGLPFIRFTMERD